MNEQIIDKFSYFKIQLIICFYFEIIYSRENIATAFKRNISYFLYVWMTAESISFQLRNGNSELTDRKNNNEKTTNCIYFSLSFFRIFWLFRIDLYHLLIESFAKVENLTEFSILAFWSLMCWNCILSFWATKNL